MLSIAVVEILDDDVVDLLSHVTQSAKTKNYHCHNLLGGHIS